MIVDDVELIGGQEKTEIVIADPDPVWSDRFREHASRIADALGSAALRVEHIGSTSVPGLRIVTGSPRRRRRWAATSS